jgi:hypothetical protein
MRLMPPHAEILNVLIWSQSESFRVRLADVVVMKHLADGFAKDRQVKCPCKQTLSNVHDNLQTNRPAPDPRTAWAIHRRLPNDACIRNRSFGSLQRSRTAARQLNRPGVAGDSDS